MKHITSTVIAAGAQRICAKSGEHSRPGMGSIAHQPAFRPILRREVMSAVNTCGRVLGLRQGAIVVLDALLSCLPCQGPDGRDLPVTPGTLLTVYASNETLCFRAKGLTDRQLRRHLDTLDKAGLLMRRDSANGKRFPIMKGGKTIGAYGLDLSPLFARADELLLCARERREQAEELRGIRAQILQLRAFCLDKRLDDATAAFIDGLRNLMRRATLTLVEARTVFARLTAVLADHHAGSGIESSGPAETITATRAPTEASAGCSTTTEAPSLLPPASIGRVPKSVSVPTTLTSQDINTSKTPASDGQKVRHIEPESDTKKRKHGIDPDWHWAELSEVNTFYDAPPTARDATVIAFEFGRMLRISQDLLASALAKLGLWDLLSIEDRIARKADSILDPDAYLKSILCTPRQGGGRSQPSNSVAGFSVMSTSA